MRDKKMFISVILLTTVILFAGGCGRQSEPVSAESAELAETVNEFDTEEHLKTTPSPTAKPEESMESAEAPDDSENEADVEDEAIVEDATSNNGTTSNGNKPNGSTSNGSTSNGTTSNGNTPVEPTPEPVHEHTWKEHYATSQTWIPNIVVVDDYEEQITEYETYKCRCGFETDDADTIAQHVKNHAYAGEIKLSGFGIQTHTKI